MIEHKGYKKTYLNSLFLANQVLSSQSLVNTVKGCSTMRKSKTQRSEVKWWRASDLVIFTYCTLWLFGGFTEVPQRLLKFLGLVFPILPVKNSLIAGYYILKRTSLVAQLVKNPPAMLKSWVQSLALENPLEQGMATHSSILAWRIPMDREAWRATVHGVTKSQTRLSN